MKATTSMEEPPIRARIPADLDTPDRLVAGLTAHQLLILAAAAVPLYAAWQGLGNRVPLPVLAAVIAPVAAIAVAVALGRRDGLSLDTWLMAALIHRIRPRRLVPAPDPGPPPPPGWAPAGTGADRDPRPAALRLPAQAFGRDGVIRTSSGSSVVLVAASTVTTGLHTPSEQAMLLGGYARWLNSLTGRVQVVVSARRVDLGTRALRVAETAHRLAHPALAAAAIEHAEHLLDLAEDGEPLTRTVTIACTADTTPATARPGDPRRRDRDQAAHAGIGATGEAARRGARTAAALAVLGSRCRVLDGAEATALLTAAVDPWGPAGPDWPRTPPGSPVTAHPALVGEAAPAPNQDEAFGREGWTGASTGWGEQDTGWAEDDDPVPTRRSR